MNRQKEEAAMIANMSIQQSMRSHESFEQIEPIVQEKVELTATGNVIDLQI